jgi:3alpha(or 20beta)-hydroxysteroid dehydrogenase
MALDGKVALITGAARGVGEATARRFTSEGARVVLGDVLDTVGGDVAAALGDTARYVHLDVTSEDSWRGVVDGIQAAEGRLDVLVNNAGILRVGSLLETSTDTFLEVMGVNQLGPFLGMRTAAPLLIESGRGAIVNVSSTQGLEGYPGLVAYVASKFAVTGMTKTVALELAEHGVRVNSVHPTGITTPMLAAAAGLRADSHDRRPTRARVPLGRMCTPDEVAGLICFLASDEASMSTGSEFLIDGGATAGPTGRGA